jgi:hypothetical protein
LSAEQIDRALRAVPGNDLPGHGLNFLSFARNQVSDRGACSRRYF